jgi:hypothetical protein
MQHRAHNRPDAYGSCKSVRTRAESGAPFLHGLAAVGADGGDDIDAGWD